MAVRSFRDKYNMASCPHCVSPQKDTLSMTSSRVYFYQDVFPNSISLLLSSFATGDPSDCPNGIGTVVSKFTFVGAVGYHQSICRNNLSLFSMWAAAEVYCTSEKEISAGESLVQGYCTGEGFDLMPYAIFLPNLTDPAIASLPLVEFVDTLDVTKVWNTSILISKTLYDTAKRTTASAYIDCKEFLLLLTSEQVTFNESTTTHKRYRLVALLLDSASLTRFLDGVYMASGAASCSSE